MEYKDETANPVWNIFKVVHVHRNKTNDNHARCKMIPKESSALKYYIIWAISGHQSQRRLQNHKDQNTCSSLEQNVHSHLLPHVSS